MPTTGGALDVSDLCTSLYNSRYSLGIRIREVDGGGDTDDLSMTTIKPGDLLPKLRAEDGSLLTDSALSVAIKESESAVVVEKKITVEPSAYAKVGASVSVADGHLSASADLKLGASFP